jgi:hypothetical protein
MGIFLVFVVLERIESFLKICAHRWWYIVVDTRFVVSIFVVIIVGEVCDLTRALYARRGALKAIERLYGEAVYFGRL